MMGREDGMPRETVSATEDKWGRGHLQAEMQHQLAHVMPAPSFLTPSSGALRVKLSRSKTLHLCYRFYCEKWLLQQRHPRGTHHQHNENRIYTISLDGVLRSHNSEGWRCSVKALKAG